MGDLATNFSHHEFACKCGQMSCAAVERGARISRALVVMFLQPVRDAVRHKIIITSGMRCAEHNASTIVGGAEHSLHVPRHQAAGWLGFAADIRPDDASYLYDVFAFLESRKPRFLGLLLDKGGVHISDGYKRDADPSHPVRWVQGLDGRRRTWVMR